MIHPKAGWPRNSIRQCVYVAGTGNNNIQKITIAANGTGTVGAFAGTATAGHADTAAATDSTAAVVATFSAPAGVAVDSSGNLFVADTGNHTIRRIVISTGKVTTFAGHAGKSGTANGAITAAQFNKPTAVAVDSSGFLYVTDTDNNRRIREITSEGVVSTLAGTVTAGAGVSGTEDTAAGPPAVVAKFSSPQGVTVFVSANNRYVYVADTGNHRIRKIDIDTDAVTTFAGSTAGSANGAGAMARFDTSRRGRGFIHHCLYGGL